MKKIKVMVPEGVRYMLWWKEYELPKGHCIVDKGVTGCGYTEYCLGNKDNVVLCSPRKLLLENKSEQHQRENHTNVIYLKNPYVKDYEGSKEFKETIRLAISKHFYDPVDGPNPLPLKLMITYDSCHYIIEILKEFGILDKFHFVVDEFQVIFLDAYYKAATEFDFVEALQECKDVVYLSATPMLDQYLQKVDEFKDLDFYVLDWSESGVVDRLTLQKKYSGSIYTECNKIVKDYLDGKFPSCLNDRGIPVYSTEAVFYFNSVSYIAKIIKHNKLKPDQVNIICADTDENDNKLYSLSSQMGCLKVKGGPRFERGKIPLKGKPNKMFTFCTKAAYVGADFYSKCASTFVFSDPNVNTLALDISLDLAQIAGRQRDEDNPFREKIVVFYKTLRGEKKLNKNEFDQVQEKRRLATHDAIDLYDRAVSDSQRATYVDKLRSDIFSSKYEKDFVGISSKTGKPVYNHFVELANERAWDVTQDEYYDNINFTKHLKNLSQDVSEYFDSVEKEVNDFLTNEFYNTGLFHEKMRLYCEFMDKHRDHEKEFSDLIYYKINNDDFRKFYNFYGTKGCSARKYQLSNLKADFQDRTNEESLIYFSILNKFKVGEKYTKKDIKFMLSELYRDLGIKRSPKASDLEKYLEIKPVMLTVGGKRENGFQIIDKKLLVL